jgi:ABC-2 type transport system ATP-binding protein
VIEVSSYSKVYASQTAVRDLSFSVAGGEILGLVGPNGAGKTTTLRAIAGVIPPTSGTLTVAGHDIVKEPLQAKRQLAIVPDDPHLFNALTVWEHLEFTAQVYGLRDWEAHAEALLADLEMTPNREKLGDELSRGMRQKVAVACALLHDPKVLLLDEPLTGLDPRGIRTLYDAVRRSAAAGAAVILSSHLLGQLEQLCTRFLIVANGAMLYDGSKDEIRAMHPSLPDGATLEDIFFHATEAQPEERGPAPESA